MRLEAVAERPDAATLALRFALDAPLERLRIPPPSPSPARRDGLWEHTCFEAFVSLDPGGPYHEINLSPSKDWAAYSFRAYREAGPLPSEDAAPLLAGEITGGRLVVTARIPLGPLRADYARAPIHLGLSAVIEAAEGGLSYLALCHAPERPDFHYAGSFALRLDPPA